MIFYRIKVMPGFKNDFYLVSSSGHLYCSGSNYNSDLEHSCFGRVFKTLGGLKNSNAWSIAKRQMDQVQIVKSTFYLEDDTIANVQKWIVVDDIIDPSLYIKAE